jgi:glycine/D-amino acid oxidase-like deaminating enzyme
LVRLDELGEVVDADVLIIGGGIGGLAAAVAAKEECPQLDVMVVEKQTAGWAGKASKIGGVLTFLGPVAPLLTDIDDLGAIFPDREGGPAVDGRVGDRLPHPP